MKSLTKDFFKTTLITSLAFIFAIGLSVVNAEWTTAPAGTPPVCPTGYPGCDAPLNVSSASQVKGGGLSVLGLLIRGGLEITSGTPGVGKVLTSDARGTATWQTVSASGTNLVDTVVYTMNTRVKPNEKNYFSISMDGVNIATGHYGGTDSQGDLTDVFIMNFTFNKVTGMFSYALDSNQIGTGNSGSVNIVNSEFSVNTNPLANAKTYFYAKYISSTNRLMLTYKTGYNSSFSVFVNKFTR